MAGPTVVIVGAGFSAALTCGHAPLLGNGPLPTLDELGPLLCQHAAELAECSGEVLRDFSPKNVEDGVKALQTHFEIRSPENRYNFEQFISLLAFRGSLFQTSLRDALPDLPGNNPAVLRFILHVLYDFFAKRLAYDGQPFVNRIFFYKVNDEARAVAFRDGLRRFTDDQPVTFISFNYDGILEAVLASHYGDLPLRFRYFPEISHGIPITAPEFLFGHPDMRKLDPHINTLAQILKPHGSMHFFQVREGVRSMLGGASMLGIMPLLDLGFDPNTMQRDLPERLRAWSFIEPTPFIVPPVMNKDSFIGSDYFRELLQLTYRAVAEAENVVVLGFSLPPSDLHVGAVLEAVNWKNKRVALYHRDGANGKTEQNWQRVVRSDSIETLNSDGIPCDSVSSINTFWEQLQRWIQR